MTPIPTPSDQPRPSTTAPRPAVQPQSTAEKLLRAQIDQLVSIRSAIESQQPGTSSPDPAVLAEVRALRERVESSAIIRRPTLTLASSILLAFLVVILIFLAGIIIAQGYSEYRRHAHPEDRNEDRYRER